MTFDTPIILYIILSFTFVIISLLFLRLIKDQYVKDLVLKIIGILTFVLHISYLWVEYLMYGRASVNVNTLFPLYFCNVNMYIMLILPFMKNREGKTFKFLAEYLFYGGTIGCIIATLFSSIYHANPNIADWYVLKSLLSHTSLLIGSLYIGIGGFIKIRVKNTISFINGIMLCIGVGFITNILFEVCGLASPNAMYLDAPPVEGIPWLTSYLAAALMIITVFIFTVIYEQIKLPKEERWYNLIKNRGGNHNAK